MRQGAAAPNGGRLRIPKKGDLLLSFMAVAPRLRVALQLLCLLCCVVIATARVAVRKLEASPAVPTATGFSTSEILGSFLRCSAAFFSIAVVVQLLIDWDAGVVDPLAKPEKKEVAEPTSDAAEPLTLMEERGVTLAAPVYPKVPTKLQGAPLPKFTMADVAKHSTKDDCWVIVSCRAAPQQSTLREPKPRKRNSTHPPWSLPRAL